LRSAENCDHNPLNHSITQPLNHSITLITPPLNRTKFIHSYIPLIRSSLSSTFNSTPSYPSYLQIIYVSSTHHPIPYYPSSLLSYSSSLIPLLFPYPSPPISLHLSLFAHLPSLIPLHSPLFTHSLINLPSNTLTLPLIYSIYRTTSSFPTHHITYILNHLILSTQSLPFFFFLLSSLSHYMISILSIPHFHLISLSPIPLSLIILSLIPLSLIPLSLISLSLISSPFLIPTHSTTFLFNHSIFSYSFHYFYT
jgi:hypothetical protein